MSSPTRVAEDAAAAGLAIARLDLLDDDACAAAYAVLRASSDHERSWNDHDSYEPTVAGWRFDDPTARTEMWAARDGETVVGIGQVEFALLDNVDKMWFQVHVAPTRRHEGVGTMLVEHLERRAREEGRREMLTESLVPRDTTGGHPYEQFATAAGFSLASTDKVRHLDLPVAQERLDALANAARPRWADAYRLETHVDGLPDALVAGYCQVSNQLGVDAPTGDVDFEEESLSPELYQQYLELEHTQGRTRLTTVAVEADTGAVVAYTDLALPSGSPTHAWQWGTLVHRSHRGHRLGTAIKVENLRRLQRDHPERTVVITGNDETNSWMVDINEALGFHLLELCRMYHRVLEE